MGVMSKLIGAIVYIIKTPFTNGANAYRYGEPIAALLVFDYFLLQGQVTKALVSYASIRIFPPLTVEDLQIVGAIVLGAAVLMGTKYFIAMVMRDL
jgi:hypothetical protein